MNIAVSPSKLPLSSTPRATMRLQLNRSYTFDDALATLPYIQALGISHVFLSPILTARAGSMHGYDVVDHGSINPELGGEEGLLRLVAGLRERGMGLIVDIVPNHMAVGGHDNARWLDVLEWGRDSHNAGFFDIDWDLPDPQLRNRILAPFLGESYGDELARGSLSLQFDIGGFYVAYHEHRFPIAPKCYPGLLAGLDLADLRDRFAQALRVRGRDARRIAFETAVDDLAQAARTPSTLAAMTAVLSRHDPGDPQGRDNLHHLLEQQHYRLAWWRTAADEINWRRFFDITGLAALRIQDRDVFEVVHAMTFRLYAAGLIDGVRVDHVDGLADPREYCRRLRSRLHELAARRPADAPVDEAYLVIEKILAPGERLAQDWQTDGTSGYSFMNDVSALLHDERGESALSWIWAKCQGHDFAEEQHRARHEVTRSLFAADFNACAHALHILARSEVETRDWTLAAMQRVLAELLAHFPVYRTYVDARGRSNADAAIMRQAIDAAAQTCRPSERPLLDHIDRWLGAEPIRAAPRSSTRRAKMRALARFQQLTSPLAAKAVEDTAFYRHGRLISRNEVGADPVQFSLPASAFHASCVDRQRRYPRALLATATHDHKRGEDVRMRLAVLSEAPQRWEQAVTDWSALNAPRRRVADGFAPDDTDEYILYQMLVGLWPPLLDVGDVEGLTTLCQRLCDWQRKAVREAKRHSDWIEPNAAYEQACIAFIRDLLNPEISAEFLASAQRFVASIAPAGALKSMSQTLLRLTTPGVPDLYQGTEFWDFSTVDPDNRRPVDYRLRREALSADLDTAQLLARWRDGAIKQRLIARTLAVRREMSAVFARGSYRPLKVTGARHDRVIAFARMHGDDAVVVIAPLHAHDLLDEPSLPLVPASHWQDTRVTLPPSLRTFSWRSVLDMDGASLAATAQLPVAEVLAAWPVALLVGAPRLEIR